MNQEDIKPNIPFWIEELLEMKEKIVNSAKDKVEPK
jgi:hypothetical protein